MAPHQRARPQGRATRGQGMDLATARSLALHVGAHKTGAQACSGEPRPSEGHCWHQEADLECSFLPPSNLRGGARVPLIIALERKRARERERERHDALRGHVPGGLHWTLGV